MPDIKYDYFDEEEAYDAASVQPRFADLQDGINDMDPPALDRGCLNSNHTGSMVSMARTVEVAPCWFGRDCMSNPSELGLVTGGPGTPGAPDAQYGPPAFIDGIQEAEAACAFNPALPPVTVPLNPVYWNYTWNLGTLNGVGQIGKQNPPPFDGCWYPIAGGPPTIAFGEPTDKLEILFPNIRDLAAEGTASSDRSSVHPGIIFMLNVQIQALRVFNEPIDPGNPNKPEGTGTWPPGAWPSDPPVALPPLDLASLYLESGNQRQIETSGVAVAIQIRGSFTGEPGTDEWFHLRSTLGTYESGPTADIWPPPGFRFRRTERRVGVQGWQGWQMNMSSGEPDSPDPVSTGHAGMSSITYPAFPSSNRDVGIRGVITDADFVQPSLREGPNPQGTNIPRIDWTRLRHINGIRAVFSYICGGDMENVNPEESVDKTVVQAVFGNGNLSIIMPRASRVEAITTT